MTEIQHPETRATHQWWAVIDDDVKSVTGYSCDPNGPDVWWCPEVGYSLTEKHHLFNSEKKAIEKLIDDLGRRIEIAKDNIEALKLRRKHINT